MAISTSGAFGSSNPAASGERELRGCEKVTAGSGVSSLLSIAGKGDAQGHRGLLGSVSALQRVVVGNNHLGGRCGGLGCGLVTQATL